MSQQKKMVGCTSPDKGWSWIVMIASCGVHIVIGSLSSCIGIVHNAFLDQFDESVAYTSWAGSMFLFLISATGPFASFLINQYSCRITAIIGGALVTLACVVSAFAPSLDWVIIFFGVIGGIGSGLTYNTAVIAVGLNFDKKRNLATGIAVSGCGIGTITFAPVLMFVESRHGYRGLLLVLASMNIHLCLFGVLFRPSFLENKRKEEMTKLAESKRDADNKPTSLKMLDFFPLVLRSTALLLFISSFFFTGFGLYMVFLHFTQFAMSQNTSNMDAAFLLTVVGICGTIFRILTGLIANIERIQEIYLYFVYFAILGITTLLLPFFAFNFMGQLVYAVILGSTYGNFYSIMNAINIEIVGTYHLASAFGLEMLAHGLGALLGPLVAGLVFDNEGDYLQSFMIAGSAIDIGGILGILTKCGKKSESYEL